MTDADQAEHQITAIKPAQRVKSAKYLPVRSKSRRRVPMRSGQPRVTATMLRRANEAAQRTQHLDPALWGPAPTPEAVQVALAANVRRQFDARHALELESVTRTAAADLLRVSPQAVTDALEARRLVGFKVGRQRLIPLWQFDADTESGTLPGLSAVAAEFPGGIVALSWWATRPNPDLGGSTPRDLLARGQLEAVLGLVRGLTASGW